MRRPVELEERETHELLILLRRACNAFVHNERDLTARWLFKALAILSPEDQLCSICLSHHADDITHSNE